MERIAILTTKEGERERERRVEGRWGEREKERVLEPLARNVSKSVLWRPPLPVLAVLCIYMCSHVCIFVSVCVCVCMHMHACTGVCAFAYVSVSERFCPCLTAIKNLRKPPQT